jgi:hypothetical protein
VRNEQVYFSDILHNIEWPNEESDDLVTDLCSMLDTWCTE